jgi:hypothetical protein
MATELYSNYYSFNNDNVKLQAVPQHRLATGISVPHRRVQTQWRVCTFCKATEMCCCGESGFVITETPVIIMVIITIVFMCFYDYHRHHNWVAVALQPTPQKFANPPTTLLVQITGE